MVKHVSALGSDCFSSWSLHTFYFEKHDIEDAVLQTLLALVLMTEHGPDI